MDRRGYRLKDKRNSYLTAFILICFLSLIWYAIPFFLFSLHHIDILGNFHTSTAEINQRLNELTGTPIYRIRPRTVIPLLSDCHWLKKVEIYTLPPNRLLLKVIERTPFLLISQENETPLLVDEEGYVLPKETQLTDFPLLIVPTVKLSQNNRISIPSFRKIRKIFEGLNDTPIKIDKLYLTPQNELNIFTKGGLEIKMGEVKDITRKLIILKALWEKIPNIEKRIEYVNLSCPSAPAIMEKVSK